jgi:DNA repair protein RadD
MIFVMDDFIESRSPEILMKITLRDYQQASVDACFDYLENNESGNPILCLPTGAGKSILIAEIINRLMPFSPSIIMVTHVKELIEQNYQKLISINPSCPAGIYSAGIGRKDVHKPITFCGIQSVYKKANLFAPVDLVIIDECHLLSPKDDATYQKFLKDLLDHNPKMRIIGLSATPYRSQGVLVGEGNLFDDIAYEVSILKLIKDGYLCRLTSKASKVQANLENVKITAGEFNTKQMAQAFDIESITRKAVSEIIDYGHNRKSWLIFGSSVEHCEHLKNEFTKKGVACEIVIGDTPKDERERILNAYKSGVLKCVINYGVLTTGFDAPQTDLIALLRATRSTGLYVQILGRGMRIAPGKEDCLILDYGGNIKRHGPVDAIRVKEKRQSDGKKEYEIAIQPTKICPECGGDNFIRNTCCAHCEYEFPIEVPIEEKHSDAAVLSIDEPNREIKIFSRVLGKHRKEGKPPSLMVTYYGSMGDKVCEWVCLEHDGYAQGKARNWWINNSEVGAQYIPATIDDAIANEHLLKPVDKITVKKEGKYDRIIEYFFKEEGGDVQSPIGHSYDDFEDEIPF